MTSSAADYEAAVASLYAQPLPALISYTQEANAHGIAGWSGPLERIVVDVRSGKIVSVTPRSSESADENSPITNYLISASCFVPTRESPTMWDGRSAVAIRVRRSSRACQDNDDINTIYADATTMQLLGTAGSETDEHMTVDINVHYGSVGKYVLPTSISAHAHGSGWLFWARERAEVRFSNYDFTETRRQAG